MGTQTRQIGNYRHRHCLVQVTKVCQPLDDLRDLAGSDSVDTFVLSYTSLLQVSCDIHGSCYSPLACIAIVCRVQRHVHDMEERPCKPVIHG